MKKTEIYILAGFLGSGKTTLLRNIVAAEKKEGRQIAVLLNEMGKVSIDTELIDKDIPLKELFDGCICCTIQEKLDAQLQEILTMNVDAIYIETTGAAHPVEVLDGIMSPLFAERLEYKGIVTVVDLVRWRDREQFSPQIKHLMLEQIQHADLLLLNKIDLVSEMEAAQMSFEIQSLNEHATCLFTKHSKVNLTQISSLSMSRKQYDGNNGKKDLHLQTILYSFKGSVHYEEFEDWLRSLPETVYRMKGYISFTHSQYPYLFQYSYGMPVTMPEIMKMPLNLVIIGENLNQDKILSELRALEQTEK